MSSISEGKAGKAYARLVLDLQAEVNTAEKHLQTYVPTLDRTTHALLRGGLTNLSFKLSSLPKQDTWKRDNSSLSKVLEQLRCLSNLLSEVQGKDFPDKPAKSEEKEILGCCEILAHIIDQASPESALTYEDLITPKGSYDDAIQRAKAADAACRRLQKVHELLTKEIGDCRWGHDIVHMVKLRATRLGGNELSFLLSKCDGQEGWHLAPCIVRHNLRPDSLKTKPPLHSCAEFYQAEKRERCLKMYLGSSEDIRTERVEVTPKLTQEHGNVPDAFLTIKDVFYDSHQARSHDNNNSSVSEFLIAWATWFTLPSYHDSYNHSSDLAVHMATVQYYLSESVLHLYSSPWLLDIWRPDNIEFPRTSASPDFHAPYLSSALRSLTPNETPFASADARYLTQSAAIFMAKFGLLILQLQIQKVLPIDKENQEKEMWPWIALDNNLKQCKSSEQFSKPLKPIMNILEACLDFRGLMYENLDVGTAGDGLNFRKTFYNHIHMPLYHAILATHPLAAIQIQPIITTQIPPHEHGENNHLAPSSEIVGETMLKRSTPAASQYWFAKFDDLTSFLREDTEPCQAERVKIAVIDSGLVEERRKGVHYEDFVESSKTTRHDNSEHGTNSVDLIRKAYSRADLYVARVFRDDVAEPDGETARSMAKAIEWAVKEKVDIISISAGFKAEHDELKTQVERATAGGAHHILVFAAASNWQNKDGVAFPASHTDRVIAIFSCNAGFTQSRQWNPVRPMAINFAMLGEDVPLDSGKTLPGGTSVSTALAAGFAARIIDFTRQADVKPSMSDSVSSRIKTKQGMTAIFEELSRKKVSEGYHCIAPWNLLPPKIPEYGDGSERENVRRKVRHSICDFIVRAVG